MSRSHLRDRQRKLFACDSPSWRCLADEQQYQIVDLLAQLLVEHLSRDQHVSRFPQPRPENETDAREDYA
jgi:hypothetical protein